MLSLDPSSRASTRDVKLLLRMPALLTIAFSSAALSFSATPSNATTVSTIGYEQVATNPVAPEYFRFPAAFSTQAELERVQEEEAAIPPSDDFITSKRLRIGLKHHIIKQAFNASREKETLDARLKDLQSSREAAQQLDDKPRIEEINAQILEIRRNHQSDGLLERSQLAARDFCAFGAVFVTGMSLELAAENGTACVKDMKRVIAEMTSSSEARVELKRDWIDPIQRIVDAAGGGDLEKYTAERDAMFAWILGVKSVAEYRVKWDPPSE